MDTLEQKKYFRKFLLVDNQEVHSRALFNHLFQYAYDYGNLLELVKAMTNLVITLMITLTNLRISLMITLTNLVNGLDNLHSTGDSPT